MRLLILTCLVVAALARPRLRQRNLELLQSQQVSSSEESVNDQYMHRELLRENQSDEIKARVMANTEQRDSSSSSSEEAEPNSTEQRQISREDIFNQVNLEQLYRQIRHNQLQLQAVFAQKCIPQQNTFYYPNMQQMHRMNAYNQLQMRQPMYAMNQELVQFAHEPYQQFYQLNTYPSWAYLPQAMQYFPSYSLFDLYSPTAPKDVVKTDMPQW